MTGQTTGTANPYSGCFLVSVWRQTGRFAARVLQGSSKEWLPPCADMSTPARSLASNWDLALTSSALLVIVGGMAAPHLKRLVGKRRDAEPPVRAPEPLLHA